MHHNEWYICTVKDKAPLVKPVDKYKNYTKGDNRCNNEGISSLAEFYFLYKVVDGRKTILEKRKIKF